MRACFVLSILLFVAMVAGATATADDEALEGPNGSTDENEGGGDEAALPAEEGAPAPKLPVKPPDLKATLFFRAGGGAAQTRALFRWDDSYGERPLDGNVLSSSGNVNQLGVTAWFYPTRGQRLILIAELYAGANSTKIHYSGEGEDLVQKKFMNYSALHMMGGLGHRFWFGKKQRYSMAYFFEAGPGGAVGEVENVAIDLGAMGGEVLAGASIQYHYSTRILFGGMINVGYRSYMNPSQKIDSSWSVKDESAELNLTSAYISFCALIGYDF